MVALPIVDADVKAKNGNSVQSRYGGDPGGFESMVGPINPITMFTVSLMGVQSDGIPAWSYYPQSRDMYLRLLSKREPIMAGALYSVISRLKSLPWNIKGGKVNQNYYQQLLADADGGAGFAQFIAKVVADLLTQDNGAFIEVVGAGRWDKPLKGRVTAIYHLDSAQCWRTFDTEFPVIYIDPLDNSYHRMHKTRVIMLSSNPQPDERARNVGFCAVSRALKMMQIVRNVETYKDEKISGKFKRAIGYGNGVTPKQFNQVTSVSDQQNENANLTIYNEIPFLLSATGEMKLDLLDLASLPDGFDYEKEINIYVYILALCFGTDAREFWPATASGATKADASVQHLKAQGKGIADIIKMIETAINWQVMPSNGGAEFEYDFTDDEQDKQQAEINTVKATNIAMYQTNGWITPQEGRALAIAQGLIDPKQLVVSADNQVADDSAPMEEEQQSIATPAQTDEFDTTVKARPYENAGPTKFVEANHPRANDGKFGSGGSTPAPAQPAPSAVPDPNASPLSNALQSFLKDNKLAGKFKGSTLTIPGDTKDRSADIQAALRASGFPNAKVTGRKTKKGYSYRISGIKPRKPREKKGKKANDVDGVEEYQDTLKGLMTDFIDTVADDPEDFAGSIDDLYSEFIDTLPEYLTDAFGVGLAGAEPTPDGIARLKKVGQTSVDYFKDSFIPALSAVSLAGLAADEIKTALNPFVSRLGEYAGAYWSSVWQGQRDATPVHLKVKRILEAGAQHCPTCPGKAGVYDSYDDMLAKCGGVPADGSDDCLSNCRCRIEVETEDGGFAPLVGSPTVIATPLFEVIK